MEKNASRSSVILVVGILVVLLGMTSSGRGEEAQQSWQFHPPEYYQNLRADVASRLEEGRAKMDLDAIPEWRTAVHADADNVWIEKETFRVGIDRSNGSICRAEIHAGSRLGDVRLCDLVLRTADGREYRQSWDTTGRVDVEDTKFRVFLRGQFTPRTRSGHPFPTAFGIEMNFHKPSGLLAVRLRPLRPVDAPRVVGAFVVNTLGRSDPPLRYLGACYYIDRDGKFQRNQERTIDSDGVHFRERLPYALWTNGIVGFQLIPVRETWEQMDIDQAARGDQYLTVKVEDGIRYLNMGFIDRPAGSALREGQGFSYSIALLPYRRYRPKTMLFGGYISYLQNEPWNTDAEEFVRAAAARGVTIANCGGGIYELLFPNARQGDAERAEKRMEVCRRYGITPLMGGAYNLGLPARLLETDAAMTLEEIQAVARDVKYPPDPAAANLFVASSPPSSTMETPEYRQYVYRHMATTKDQIPATGGFYMDLMCVFAGVKGWPSQIEGNVQYMQDLRILMNSYEPPLSIVWHAGTQITPAEAMADSIMPGEHSHGAGRTRLTEAEQMIIYNPLLLGTQVPLYIGKRGYRMDDPQLYKQVLRNCVYGNTNDYGTRLAIHDVQAYAVNFTDSERAAFNRYFLPFVTFDVGRSTLHHPNQADYDQYVRVSDPRATAYSYCRDGEALVVAVGPPDVSLSSEVLVRAASLGIREGRVAAYDVVRDRLEVVGVRAGWIDLGRVDLTHEPRIFALTRVPDDGSPVFVWRHHLIDITSELRFDPEVHNGFLNYVGNLNVRLIPAEGLKGWAKVYCNGHGAPGNVFDNSNVVDYDPKSQLLTVDAVFPPTPITQPHMNIPVRLQLCFWPDGGG